MDRIAFKAEFARKADEAQSIMSQMRTAAAKGANSLEESRKRIEESWAILRQAEGD